MKTNTNNIEEEEDLNRKRKMDDGGYNSQIPKRHQEIQNQNDFLSLKLNCSSPQPLLDHQEQLYIPTSGYHIPDQIQIQPPVSNSMVVSRPLRTRRNPTQTPSKGKSETIPAPFPWATTSRAKVHSLSHLLSNNIFSIKGEVQCKKCDKIYEMEFDLKEKFVEIGNFIVENKSGMHDRAPSVWMNPVLPSCRYCEQENSVKPVIPVKKKEINWLFLLLGQMLGCCTLEQLKYFCKHTKNHRTGAKDRVLYLTYLCLCKQLDPSGPFDRRWWFSLVILGFPFGCFSTCYFQIWSVCFGLFFNLYSSCFWYHIFACMVLYWLVSSFINICTTTI